MIDLRETVPRDWDARIAFPLQSEGYAQAARALGYRPLFVDDPAGLALVLIRRVPVPVLAGWTARAKVYAHINRREFLPALVDRLRTLGVAHVKIGDSVWGVSGVTPEYGSVVRPVVYYSFVHDVTADDATILARADRIIRRHVRKALTEVTVTEVRTAADLAQYVQLAIETGTRMRFRDVPAVYPSAYFEAMLDRMVPRGHAVMYLARAKGTPIAASAFVVTDDRFVHIHGASTRDRALTPKQGPTALFWHAMRSARARGCQVLDMGAVTPTDDPTHPHYSVLRYKKLWGGRLVEVRGAEVVVAPWKHRFQEYLLAPMWDRVHPLYLRVFGHETPPPAHSEPAATPIGQHP